jgi:hypothetical protein
VKQLETRRRGNKAQQARYQVGAPQRKVLQLTREYLQVPASIQCNAVIDQDQRTPLRFRQAGQHNDGDSAMPRCRQPAVTAITS